MIGPHTVTVINPAGRDEWGDTQSGGVETDVPGCFWQPETSTEETLGQRDLVTVIARVFMPPIAPVAATSRIRFDGVTYEVHGQPALYHTPAGAHHYEVQLRAVQGG